MRAIEFLTEKSSQSHGRLDEIKKGQKDSNGYTKCWSGYHAAGTKKSATTGKQVRNCVPNESVEEGKQRMSRAAKGNEKYGKDGMKALAQAGREGASEKKMDAIRDKHDNYNENVEEGREENKKWRDQARDASKEKRAWSPTNLPNYKKSKEQEYNKNKEQDLAENFDPEYDDEAGMFKNDLQTIQRVSADLEKTIYDNENLPEWCQAKIAQAKGMVVGVMDYMISQHENGIVDTVNEEFNLIESAINHLALYNQVDVEEIWEDLESLTDDELYVFAVTQPIMEDWQKVNKKDKTDGMSKKAVSAYRRENPGSKLKTAVTTEPSKLKKGSKSSKRRKSYCSRSRGQMKMHNISCAKTPDKAICKARRRWNCE